jgi:hypothetical protein
VFCRHASWDPVPSHQRLVEVNVYALAKPSASRRAQLAVVGPNARCPPSVLRHGGDHEVVLADCHPPARLSMGRSRRQGSAGPNPYSHSSSRSSSPATRASPLTPLTPLGGRRPRAAPGSAPVGSPGEVTRGAKHQSGRRGGVVTGGRVRADRRGSSLGIGTTRRRRHPIARAPGGQTEGGGPFRAGELRRCPGRTAHQYRGWEARRQRPAVANRPRPRRSRGCSCARSPTLVDRYPTSMSGPRDRPLERPLTPLCL